MADESELAVLVCSANVGNAEPTPESFGEWIPNDGEIEGPLSNTKYPVDADGAAEACASLTAAAGKKFDIIVIGMQEASFIEKKAKHLISPGDGEGTGVDCSERSDSNMSNYANGVPETVHDGVSEIVEDCQKGKNKLMRKVVQANMIVRGLTTSQTYKAPALRNSLNHQSKVNENSAVRSGSYDTRKFLELIEERLPSYGMIVAKLRGEMRLIVLALKDLSKEISDVHIAGENTGIGNVLANKGGIIATLDLRGTRLSFMTCHLEAHEGNSHYANRNKNLAEIFAGAKTDPNYNLHDATIISHHMFVCGDLNYRINLGESDKTKMAGGARRRSTKRNMKLKKSAVFSKKEVTNKLLTESGSSAGPPPSLLDEPVVEESPVDEKKAPAEMTSSSSHLSDGSPPNFFLAKILVEAEEWKTLNDGDELAMALKRKDCLAGFTTLPCNFPPTFKVARGDGYQYNEKRTPSYTDRILWKSADGMADNVVPFLYEPCPDFKTSDHKPIRGGYNVKMNRGPGKTSSPPNAKHGERQVQLLVTDIKCTNLPIMDAGVLGGLSDPYILFVSSPKPMLWKKAWPSTKVIKKSLNPVWEQDMHLTLDQDACGEDSLNGAMLFMTVMDEDFSSGDDVIGTTALNLNNLCSDLNINGENGDVPTTATQSTEISRPILRNGQQFGMLECTITSAYLTAKETKTFLKTAKNKVRSKTRHESASNKLFAMLPF